MNVVPILQMRNTNMKRGQVTHPRSKSHMWAQEVCIQGWLHTTPCSPLIPLCLHDIGSLPTSGMFGEGEGGLQMTKQDSIDGNEVGWRKEHKGGCEKWGQSLLMSFMAAAERKLSPWTLLDLQVRLLILEFIPHLTDEGNWGWGSRQRTRERRVLRFHS